jgi:hypothetical protein
LVATENRFLLRVVGSASPGWVGTKAVTNAAQARARAQTAEGTASARRAEKGSEKGLSLLGRFGLAGRTAFYLILTGLTIRIAILGGVPKHQANANGALSLVSRPLLGKVAIAIVALGFAVFGIARLVGAVQDHTVSRGRRWMTAAQGVFYLILASVPASFLAGRQQAGSQQQQQKTTARLLGLPGGRWIVIAFGVIFIAVCAVQIRGAIRRDFREGLELEGAPRLVRRIADAAGAIGITARSLVFLPIGIFLIVAAIQFDPNHAYGTDVELLRLSGHPWGIAILAVVSVGLAIFVVFSCIETRYRNVVSAR